MKNDYLPQHLNVEVFARLAGTCSGTVRLGDFERLIQESVTGAASVLVEFTAQGEMRGDEAQGEHAWLHLEARTVLAMTCQRCLGPVDVGISAERSFRFVATEALAETEDEESEEDVLVASRDFDLLALVEDELLMALPPVPKHEVCPVPVKLEARDADFAEEDEPKPNPFAVLEQLKKKS
ncbi:YceD family protein [Rhodoferax aquaticus]|uniref:Large ribosomal RNA subunit accumulation protein YceD n=1 Tax=Rhodoferax aquaticus TaxID=2527691 RepID=A0A515ERY8_9BURK|nr:DUF177 domain-containing protein [Rhodoferax aquaticus]QDL55432.1 DUF177 domain-containing protein [Rhodoferax aquaticus]